jgi:hypothetical protein
LCCFGELFKHTHALSLSLEREREREKDPRKEGFEKKKIVGENLPAEVGT